MRVRSMARNCAQSYPVQHTNTTQNPRVSAAGYAHPPTTQLKQGVIGQSPRTSRHLRHSICNATIYLAGWGWGERCGG